MTRQTIIKLTFFLLLLPNIMLGQEKNQMFEASNKFNTMWWLGSINYDQDLKFAIQTSDYGMLFNYRTLAFESLWINENTVKESEFIKESNQNLIPSNQAAGFEFGFMDAKGQKTSLKSSNELKDCQLIASGRYFQKRFMNNLKGAIVQDSVANGLDFAAFPDRFNLLYKFSPRATTSDISLYMDFELPASYKNVSKDKDGNIVCSQANGMGFIIMPSTASSSISLEGNTIAVQTKPSSFVKDNEYEVGCIVYPFKDLKQGIAKMKKGFDSSLKVQAEMIDPEQTKLNVSFNKNEGFYEIVLGEGEEKGENKPREEVNPNRPNDVMNTVDFSVTNDSSEDQVARLNFSYPKGGFSISGVSSVLCDENGMPMGIPMQITKNWHRKAGNHDRYQGPWINMITTFTVPAKTTLNLQYKQMAAYWGTLPAVSHAQLALPGWGSSHQLWDQSATGSWGESLCYSPDGNVGAAVITDVRATYTTGSSGAPFKWGGNVGGGDIIYLRDNDYNRIHHENIRIERKRYAPNLCEMVYSGDIKDGAISFEYSTILGRTDDMVKGYYKMKMKVNKDIKFNEIAFFQSAAYKYHYSYSRKISYGDVNGVRKTWAARNAPPLLEYVGEPVEADANSSWIAFTDSELIMEDHMIPSNRGVIIREWNAKLGGKENVSPYWREYLTGDENSYMKDNRYRSIMNLTVPEDCKELKAGDYLEAVVELIVYQEQRSEYCGPNEKFASALEANPESWKIVQREAQENKITANISKGELLSNYPLLIKATDNKVEGEIIGGLAYAPVTITGLSEYANPVFYVKHKDTWEVVDQAVRGNDFWQSDYNVSKQCWEITYNIPLDRDDYTKPCGIKFEFK